MKHISRILLICLLIGVIAGCFVSCDTGKDDQNGDDKLEFVDYVSQLKLDMTSNTNKIEVTVKQYIDGDTTHFNVPTSVSANGILKARYLAVNTPESTGKIEEWGKKASNYTKEKLKSATSIYIESDDDNWNVDSTGSRYLVWIWYKTAEDEDYRNLNLELLQEGLAIASNSANNRYGEYCMNAINQAKAHLLYVYSDEKDPDFYYGEYQEVTIKELRTNPEAYVGTKVAFEGIVSKNTGDNGVFIEAFDEETGVYNGIQVYYGFSFSGLSILKPGNKVRMIGSMQYYEAGGTYQISDVKYSAFEDVTIKKLESGIDVAFTEIDAETFLNGKVSVTVMVDGEETIKDFKYAELTLNTSVSMKNLKVEEVYTTNNGGSSDGAMTLTCSVNGERISVRTTVLTDDNKNVITASAFEGKTIDVKGIIDYYDGSYQIKVLSIKDINIQ